MKQALTTTPADIQPAAARTWRVAGWAAVLVLLAGLAGWLILTQGPGMLARSRPGLSPEAFAEATGIQIHLIGVSGGGGIVDFRYKVVDAAKAADLLHDPANAPVLLIEDGRGTTLRADPAAFNVTFEDGSTYFVFYVNSQSVVKRGTQVTAVIGDYRLKHLTAQ